MKQRYVKFQKRIQYKPLVLPKAGHTVYDHNGTPIQIIRANRKGDKQFSDCWFKGERCSIEFKQDGTLINFSVDWLIDNPFRNEAIFKRYWHYDKKKAKRRSPMVRMLPRKLPPIHIITAKAPEPGEYKEPDFLSGISGSCRASVDMQVFVQARVIEDPNNPENNGRPITMRMSKSRLDTLSNLAKDLKELK
jgi:hypothetical protein